MSDPTGTLSEVVVQKYGGSSVASVDRILRVADRIGAAHRARRPTVVVVSAMGDTTDDLVRLAHEVNPEPASRELDQLFATGESVSAALLAMTLQRLGVPAVSLTGQQAGIRVAGSHGTGLVQAIDVSRIWRLLRERTVAVVAGFQGVNADNDVVTLGRGGSDTTAVALAVELNAARCEIYTDVPGVYSADPRIVSSARPIPVIGVAAMAEMAFSGAKVLHARSVEFAAIHGIDIHVLSSFEEKAGTVVLNDSNGDGLEMRGTVVGIAHDLDAALVQVRPGRAWSRFATDLLTLVATESLPVDQLAGAVALGGEVGGVGGAGDGRVCLTVRRADADTVTRALRRLAARYDARVGVDLAVGTVSVIGIGLLSRPRHTARTLATLADHGIPVSSLATSQHRISVTVPRERVGDAVRLLHTAFGLDDRSVRTAGPADWERTSRAA